MTGQTGQVRTVSRRDTTGEGGARRHNQRQTGHENNDGTVRFYKVQYWTFYCNVFDFVVRYLRSWFAFFGF